MEERSLVAFQRADQLYREATAERKPEKIEAAKQALEEYRARYPRRRPSPLANYYLANLHYQDRAYEDARSAYTLALERGAKGDLALLCQLAIAYSWEAQGQYANALRAYQDGVARTTPKHFLFEEFLLAQARMQELQKEGPRAIDAYRQLLREHPESRRAQEIRSRIAFLEGQGSR